MCGPAPQSMNMTPPGRTRVPLGITCNQVRPRPPEGPQAGLDPREKITLDPGSKDVSRQSISGYRVS